MRLQFFDGEARAWRRVRSGGDGGWRRLGSGDREVQGGTTFTFPPPDAGRRLVLRGLVDVEWRKRRRAVERRRLRTTAGHADAADPALPDLAPVVRDQAVANSRGSLVMTPVTPRRSSAAMRAASSTVHT